MLLPALNLLEYQAQTQGSSILYVAPGSDCGDAGPCYAHPQDAVDAANIGDVIKVAAGTYTGVTNYGGLAQVVYISKTLTLRGGYTITNWAVSDPVANPTTMDAQRQGRVLYISGDGSTELAEVISPTIECLRITAGDADGLGGGPWGRDAGGGVYIINATATVRHNQVFNNAAVLGGGLYLHHSASILSGNGVTSNAARYGGGLRLNRSDATLSGNIITSNTAEDDGGGIYLNRSDAMLSGNTIAANTAQPFGGGLCLWRSDATLSGNTVTSNTARYGGGMHLDQSDATLSGNTLTFNTAYDRGGGLYVYGNSSATLSGNTLTSNTADCGGGMYIYQSTATLSGNTLTSNTADYGGGMYLFQSDATLTSNLVADNQASSTGSGLYIKGSLSDLLHTTIACNGSAEASAELSRALAEVGSAELTAGSSGDGSGVYATNSGLIYSTVALTNTIVVSHTVGITVTAGSTATLEATLWGTDTWANATDWDGAGTIITGIVNLWGDPAFVDPKAGDYHIGPGSAAIDAGVNAGVTTDIDGRPRPMGDGFDIGADEYFPVVGVIYLPLMLRSYSPSLSAALPTP